MTLARPLLSVDTVADGENDEIMPAGAEKVTDEPVK